MKKMGTKGIHLELRFKQVLRRVLVLVPGAWVRKPLTGGEHTDKLKGYE